MLKLLFIPFIIFFMIVVFIISALGNIIRAIFGVKSKKDFSNNPYTKQQNRKQKQENYTRVHPNHAKSESKKIISKDEGEYVDFEEID